MTLLCVTGDQSQLSPTSAAPATQNAGRCRRVPRLPRKTQVDATKYHACRTSHVGRQQTQPSPISATPATQNAGRCRQVPRHAVFGEYLARKLRFHNLTVFDGDLVWTHLFYIFLQSQLAVFEGDLASFVLTTSTCSL